MCQIIRKCTASFHVAATGIVCLYTEVRSDESYIFLMSKTVVISQIGLIRQLISRIYDDICDTVTFVSPFISNVEQLCLSSVLNHLLRKQLERI